MPTYSKPHLSFEEQLSLLKSRGISVSEDNIAINYLRKIGYYRLGIYWYVFQKLDYNDTTKRSDEFVNNAQFNHVVNLYVYDKKLRLIIMDAIERIEIAVRVGIAYNLSKFDIFAHLNETFFNDWYNKKSINNETESRFELMNKKMRENISKSKEDYIRSFKDKYDESVPIMLSIEAWDFGILSHFFEGLKGNYKNDISSNFGILERGILESWLKSLNEVRNIVAHHGRLWNKTLVNKPKFPRAFSEELFPKYKKYATASPSVYSIVCILSYFMNVLGYKSNWKNRIIKHVEEFPENPFYSIQDMGFPVDWESEPFWKYTP